MKNTDRIFEPSEKDYRTQYPELSEIAEFQTLTDKELRFAWYFANPSSIFKGIPRRQRMAESIIAAFGEKDITSRSHWGARLPDNIQDACDRMAQMNVTLRHHAKKSVEKVFRQIESITDISPEQLNDMDIKNRKDYVDLGTKVIREMPEMVRIIENGFGVKTVRKAKTKNETDIDEGMMESVMRDIDSTHNAEV